MSSSAGPGREYIHLKLPVSTKELLRRLRYETRVSITDIVVRVLERSHKEAVLEDWIREGASGSPGAPPREEAVSAER